ncbi:MULTISPECIES: hypothetical protein [unclassified Mesorhizobium]|uniref:hypothetical protein n=1 Tax=unclassified Mesorhizobium TaxID=325217 RepID=UPI000A81C557|nr:MULTISPECIES: hypothetical protein [unclassified Mesorhizobium]
MAAMPDEIFSATIDFSVKLSGGLDRRDRCRLMAGFFLATPGDPAGLPENAVRLFPVFPSAKPPIVSVASIHF